MTVGDVLREAAAAAGPEYVRDFILVANPPQAKLPTSVADWYAFKRAEALKWRAGPNWASVAVRSGHGPLAFVSVGMARRPTDAAARAVIELMAADEFWAQPDLRGPAERESLTAFDYPLGIKGAWMCADDRVSVAGGQNRSHVMVVRYGAGSTVALAPGARSVYDEREYAAELAQAAERWMLCGRPFYEYGRMFRGSDAADIAAACHTGAPWITPPSTMPRPWDAGRPYKAVKTLLAPQEAEAAKLTKRAMMKSLENI